MDPFVLTSIILGLLIVLGGGASGYFISRRQRLERFENRPELRLDQIYGEFFAGKNLPKELACELWNEVATCLQLPSGKLRPSDRFDQELAAPKGWEFDDEILDVQWAAERRLKRSKEVKADLSHIRTLGDYVEFFCDLARRKQKA